MEYENKELEKYVQKRLKMYEKFLQNIKVTESGCRLWKHKSDVMMFGDELTSPEGLIFSNMDICPICKCGDCYEHENVFYAIARACGTKDCLNREHCILYPSQLIFNDYKNNPNTKGLAAKYLQDEKELKKHMEELAELEQLEKDGHFK